jgi:hypothetical protein
MASLEFDRSNKRIRVLAPDASTTIQEIYDKSQAFLAKPENMDVRIFVEASGKKVIDPGPPEQRAFILLDILDGWLVEFEARGAGPVVQCRITGGVIIAAGGSVWPIAETDFTHVAFAQTVSGTLIVTGGGVGTPSEVAEAVWDALEAEHEVTGSFGARMRKLLTKALFLALNR